MGTTEIVLGIVLGLVVNEMTDLSPWLGRKMVTWSAWLRYRDSPRAGIRAEELAAVINDRPGKLFKLGTGFGFLCTALVAFLRRLVVGEPETGSEAVPEDLLGSRRQVVEDEPTPLVAQYLFPTERYRGEWRRHWIHPVKGITIILIYAVLGVWAANVRIKPQYVGWVVAIVVVGAVLLVIHRLLSWYLGRFVITNKRLVATEGVFFRRVGMIPLLRVTDMRYVQSPVGRILNYGTFQLESASRRNALRQIVDLPSPNELYLRLVEEMYEPEAVQARLGGYSDEELSDKELADEAYPEDATTLPADPARTDPALVRREVIHRIGELSSQLASLTRAIERLDPGPAVPHPVAAGTAPPTGAAGDDPAGFPEVREPGQPMIHRLPRRRLPPAAGPLPDTGD